MEVSMMQEGDGYLSRRGEYEKEREVMIRKLLVMSGKSTLKISLTNIGA